MTDLTEQWKKGELILDKSYYLRLQDGSEEIQMYVGGFLFNENNPVDEVLAPVPSYEEYLSLTYAKEEDEKIIAEYEEENAQLKELLKRCRDKLFEIYSDEVSHPEAVPIIKKLDEVLKGYETINQNGD